MTASQLLKVPVMASPLDRLLYRSLLRQCGVLDSRPALRAFLGDVRDKRGSHESANAADAHPGYAVITRFCGRQGGRGWYLPAAAAFLLPANSINGGSGVSVSAVAACRAAFREPAPASQTELSQRQSTALFVLRYMRERLEWARLAGAVPPESSSPFLRKENPLSDGGSRGDDSLILVDPAVDGVQAGDVLLAHPLLSRPFSRGVVLVLEGGYEVTLAARSAAPTPHITDLSSAAGDENQRGDSTSRGVATSGDENPSSDPDAGRTVGILLNGGAPVCTVADMLHAFAPPPPPPTPLPPPYNSIPSAARPPAPSYPSRQPLARSAGPLSSLSVARVAAGVSVSAAGVGGDYCGGSGSSSSSFAALSSDGVDNGTACTRTFGDTGESIGPLGARGTAGLDPLGVTVVSSDVDASTPDSALLAAASSTSDIPLGPTTSVSSSGRGKGRAPRGSGGRGYAAASATSEELRAAALALGGAALVDLLTAKGLLDKQHVSAAAVSSPALQSNEAMSGGCDAVTPCELSVSGVASEEGKGPLSVASTYSKAHAASGSGGADDMHGRGTSSWVVRATSDRGLGFPLTVAGRTLQCPAPIPSHRNPVNTSSHALDSNSGSIDNGGTVLASVSTNPAPTTVTPITLNLSRPDRNDGVLPGYLSLPFALTGPAQMGRVAFCKSFPPPVVSPPQASPSPSQRLQPQQRGAQWMRESSAPQMHLSVSPPSFSPSSSAELHPLRPSVVAGGVDCSSNASPLHHPRWLRASRRDVRRVACRTCSLLFRAAQATSAVLATASDSAAGSGPVGSYFPAESGPVGSPASVSIPPASSSTTVAPCDRSPPRSPPLPAAAASPLRVLRSRAVRVGNWAGRGASWGWRGAASPSQTDGMLTSLVPPARQDWDGLLRPAPVPSGADLTSSWGLAGRVSDVISDVISPTTNDVTVSLSTDIAATSATMTRSSLNSGIAVDMPPAGTPHGTTVETEVPLSLPTFRHPLLSPTLSLPAGVAAATLAWPFAPHDAFTVNYNPPADLHASVLPTWMEVSSLDAAGAAQEEDWEEEEEGGDDKDDMLDAYRAPTFHVSGSSDSAAVVSGGEDGIAGIPPAVASADFVYPNELSQYVRGGGSIISSGDSANDAASPLLPPSATGIASASSESQSSSPSSNPFAASGGGETVLQARGGPSFDAAATVSPSRSAVRPIIVPPHLIVGSVAMGLLPLFPSAMHPNPAAPFASQVS